MPEFTQPVRVNLAERSYDIEIGSGNLEQVGRLLVGRLLAERGKVSHVVVITDENVQEPYAIRVAESLAGESIEVDVVAVEPGEPSKSIDMVAGLWTGMLELGSDRKTVVAAVGGGVVGDLAGFVAATYARGVRFLQVPTSLLAQVDSSVGGKVGINLPEAKNMVGAFMQPIGVLIDTATLATLPPREYRAGLAEVVKYGVILDAELFNYLEANAAALLGRDDDALARVISRCCRLKADVVEKDEREETGLRAVLNYGHTFAHPLEALAGYGRILHGEAVAIGMVCASRLAERTGRVDDGFTDRQRRLLETLGLPVELPELDREQIIRAMMHDKKVQHGRLRFVLPSRMGHVEVVEDVDAKDVRAALDG
ncbi:MAG: 3-dehydroquinate synthase [Planctomycetes bacterium RBG_13_63_9]|nr:MAG: 3-dehydroquinate synthase [Planctomycetes bacterium RBG_13_63_9]